VRNKWVWVAIWCVRRTSHQGMEEAEKQKGKGQVEDERVMGKR